MHEDLSDPATWNARYAEGRTGWDLGGPAEALLRCLCRFEGQHLEVLVPGAGRGHDAIAWSRAGHRVTALDFAPQAVQAARRLAREQNATLQVAQEDLFALPPRLQGKFDLIWEHTCLCALDPARRPEYVCAMAGALRQPAGRWFALLWNHQRQGGPPFDLSPDTVKALLETRFRVTEPTPVKGTQRPGEYLLEGTLRTPGEVSPSEN